MKRTKLAHPYNEDGSTAFPARNLPGCYLIYRKRTNTFGSSTMVLHYVGYGRKDVYKALYRHFQVWNDRQAERGERSDRTTYAVRADIRVRVIYCRTGAQAEELEKALILKHRPKDNPDKLEFYTITPAGEALASEASEAELVENPEAPF